MSKLPLDAGTAEAIEDAALLNATERLDQLQAATEAELAPRVVLKPTAEPAGAPTPAKITETGEAAMAAGQVAELQQLEEMLDGLHAFQDSLGDWAPA